jgi:hypothetical protein
MTVTFEAKEISLWGVTGLVVAYVRHGLEHQWQWWDSIEQFFVALRAERHSKMRRRWRSTRA